MKRTFLVIISTHIECVARLALLCHAYIIPSDATQALNEAEKFRDSFEVRLVLEFRVWDLFNFQLGQI